MEYPFSDVYMAPFAENFNNTFSRGMVVTSAPQGTTIDFTNPNVMSAPFVQDNVNVDLLQSKDLNPVTAAQLQMMQGWQVPRRS